MVGLASSETNFLDAITLTFKEFRANILDIDDMEILDLRGHLDDVDPDILGAISLLSAENKLELEAIDYYFRITENNATSINFTNETQYA